VENSFKLRSPKKSSGYLVIFIIPNSMSIVVVEKLSKVYPVAVKQPGLKGTWAHFFRRTYREIKAVQNISFEIEAGEVVGFLGLALSR
jgi:ABC-type oligopeptide transport system ATPase subunit